MAKSLVPKDKLNKLDEFLEYKIDYSFLQFINEKGIEFLIFMLHVMNSLIKDKKAFNLYIYKTIDFINSLYSNYNIFKKQYSYFEFDSDFIKQINLFFLTLLFILKKNKNNNLDNTNDNYLSNEVRNSLINCLSLKFKNSNYHIDIIVSILFGNEFFEKNANLNESIIDKIDISIINEKLIYYIFLMDSLFLVKNIKHKKLFIFLNSLFSSNHRIFFCNELVKYIVNIKNEIKLYHYLKLL